MINKYAQPKKAKKQLKGSTNWFIAASDENFLEDEATNPDIMMMYQTIGGTLPGFTADQTFSSRENAPSLGDIDGYTVGTQQIDNHVNNLEMPPSHKIKIKKIKLPDLKSNKTLNKLIQKL